MIWEGKEIYMNEIIVVNHVTKIIKNAALLDNVNFTVERGTISGIVGRNGSGKTVLFKCICGFMNISSGSIEVDGKRMGQNGRLIENAGIIIEEPGFIPIYSGLRNLMLLANLNHTISKEEIKDVMIKVGLDPSEKKAVKTYSMGMKQRLAIAQAVMENPDIIILDEPMNGLDDSGTQEIRKLFLDLKKEGKTFLIASHIKEDIDVLCDSVYRMDAGKLEKIS